MAKVSGGTRLLRPTSKSNSNKRRFEKALSTGKYLADKCYLSKSGAIVLVEYGHNLHKVELEAARSLADYGYSVLLTSENNIEMSTKTKRDGTPKYSDGKITLEELTYEQSTPQTIAKRGPAISVHKSLEHAKSKGSDVAIIYDRSRLFHRNDIENGIKEYESHQTNRHRFKAIIVIDGDRNVHEWTHNK